MGWHTLVLQIANGTATYYTDGKLLAAHGGKYYPEVPMSINYNLWFISGGQLSPAKARDNIEQVDWVYFAANTVISPENIEGRVADLRKKNVPFTDSVSPSSPPLDSPCNF